MYIDIEQTPNSTCSRSSDSMCMSIALHSGMPMTTHPLGAFPITDVGERNVIFMQFLCFASLALAFAPGEIFDKQSNEGDDSNNGAWNSETKCNLVVG